MRRESINPWDWGLKWHMDQAETVEGVSRRLNCSGQVSVQPDPGSEIGLSVVSPDDMRGQIACTLSNLDAVLENADMSRKNLIHLRFFTTNIDSFLANYDIYAEWIAPAEIRPPQSLLEVQRLFLPELQIEIEATAAE